MKYNCPSDCSFQLKVGGDWDNPQIGGCSIDDKFPLEMFDASFEKDISLSLCPFYMRPLLINNKRSNKRNSNND